MTSETCICTALRMAAQSSTGFYDDILAPSGLKVTMFRLLRRIEDNPDVSITGLARLTGLDRSTLGRNLRVLEKQGLVALPTGADERARALSLTPRGQAALSTARPLWAKAQTRMRATVGQDLDTMLTTLARLATLQDTPTGDRT